MRGSRRKTKLSPSHRGQALATRTDFGHFFSLGLARSLATLRVVLAGKTCRPHFNVKLLFCLAAPAATRTSAATRTLPLVSGRYCRGRGPLGLHVPHDWGTYGKRQHPLSGTAASGATIMRAGAHPMACPSLPPCRPVTRSFHLHLSILEYFVWRRDLQASPECLVCEGVPESSAPFIPGTGMDSTTAGQGARRSLRRFCSHLCGWQRPEPLIVSATLCCPGFMPQPARAQSSAVQL